MAYGNGANGAANDDVPQGATLEPVAFGDLQAVPTSQKRWQTIRDRLTEPFDPGEIKWRVTATSTHQTKNGPKKRGQVVAYADQRAYTDRLNDVFGEWGWTRSYDVQVAQNFERRAPGDNARTTVAAKVVVVSKVTIHGLGSHTGVGEEWAHDENAATRAEAQAFKRACACFGLGRYLYDLETVWVDLDDHNRPLQTPKLPEWAMPAHARRDTERHATNHTQSAPTRNIADARGHLLQAARRMADETRRRLADIISEASDGKLSLEGLRDLTDADVPVIAAATARLSRRNHNHQTKETTL